MQILAHPIHRLLCTSAVVAVSLAALGCNRSKEIAVEPQPAVETAAKPDKVEPTAKPAEPEKPATAAWDEQLAEVESQLKAEKIAESQHSLEQLRAIAPATSPPDASRDKTIADLESRLNELITTHGEREREEKLAEAGKLMDLGKMAAATEALEFVLSNSPTTKQQESAAKIAREIERRRNVMSSLKTWIEMLGSGDRKDVRAAKAELSRESASALPLLVDAIQQSSKPAVVVNALETLRSLGKPQLAVPVFMDVLRQTDRQKYWNDVVRELGRMEVPALASRCWSWQCNPNRPSSVWRR